MPLHHQRPLPPGLLASAEEWGRTEGQMTPLERQKEMNRQRAMAGESGYASVAPPQSRMSRIWDHLRHGIPRRVEEFLEPETPAEMGGLLGASVMEPAGTAIDVADFAIGFRDRDLPRMGWAAGGAALPFVAGSTMRKVLGKGAKAADELPMDEASRTARAAEQDWTINAFHGTSRGSLEGGDLERFNWGSHFGTKGAANDRLSDLRGALPESIQGDRYRAPQLRPGERVMPVKLRGKFLDLGDENEMTGVMWSPEELLRSAQEKGVLTASEVEHAFDNVPRAPIDPMTNRIIRGGFEEDVAIKKAVTDLFQKKGFAGVSYTNAVEDIGSTSYMVFDPANIRSSMAAAFDPAQAGSANLVAGGAGLLGAGIARSQRERE
jgi:hypothetical protein